MAWAILMLFNEPMFKDVISFLQTAIYIIWTNADFCSESGLSAFVTFVDSVFLAQGIEVNLRRGETQHQLPCRFPSTKKW